MIDLKGKRVHFVGVGGISMSALCVLVMNKGATVSGSDLCASRITEKLERIGVQLYHSHSAGNVKNADIVVYSPAINAQNPEIVQAKKMGLILIRREILLCEIASEYQNVITIAGSHGKTTTTGMVASCFLEAGLDPTVHIGGEMPRIDGNVHIGNNYYFISEACEYVDSFLNFKNQMVSCALNVQADHMDYFKTIDNLQNSFKKYLNNTNKIGFRVVNLDDEFLKSIRDAYADVSYSIADKSADYRAYNIRECRFSRYSFDVSFKNKKLTRIKLNVTGKHQIYNALACFVICSLFGIDFKLIKRGLENFKGIKRRFEDVGEINGAKVFHDYAHHPTEIEANIKATKKFTKGKLYVVFQPHTFSRTKALWEDFKTCFSSADEVVIYKIYPAREEPIDGITAESLATSICLAGHKAKSCNDYKTLLGELKSKTTKNDIILILGAGDIESFCDYFKKF